MIDSYKTIKKPVATEKAIRMMESENKLTFIVDKAAHKSDIKRAVEELFKVKVTKVNTMIAPSGEKKAFVRLSDENPAIDVATKLGVM